MVYQALVRLGWAGAVRKLVAVRPVAPRSAALRAVRAVRPAGHGLQAKGTHE
jgi:hypothetical protein